MGDGPPPRPSPTKGGGGRHRAPPTWGGGRRTPHRDPPPQGGRKLNEPRGGRELKEPQEGRELNERHRPWDRSAPGRGAGCPPRAGSATPVHRSAGVAPARDRSRSSPTGSRPVPASDLLQVHEESLELRRIGVGIADERRH